MTLEDENFEFGDEHPDDAFDPHDEEVNWDNVEQLAADYEQILSIEDDAKRLAAAQAYVTKLAEKE